MTSDLHREVAEKLVMAQGYEIEDCKEHIKFLADFLETAYAPILAENEKMLEAIQKRVDFVATYYSRGTRGAQVDINKWWEHDIAFAKLLNRFHDHGNGKGAIKERE